MENKEEIVKMRNVLLLRVGTELAIIRVGKIANGYKEAGLGKKKKKKTNLKNNEPLTARNISSKWTICGKR